MSLLTKQQQPASQSTEKSDADIAIIRLRFFSSHATILALILSSVKCASFQSQCDRCFKSTWQNFREFQTDYSAI